MDTERVPHEDKETKTVFVIMPFSRTPTRDAADLTEFFQTNLKERIEAETSFKYRYVVSRSDDTFNITKKIIRDLYTADVVLCDLSGNEANPNVMYELGVRLAISNAPVILFREANKDNRRIFDIDGFYIEEYEVTKYRPLGDYIVRKLKRFEDGRNVPTLLRQQRVGISVVGLASRAGLLGCGGQPGCRTGPPNAGTVSHRRVAPPRPPEDRLTSPRPTGEPPLPRVIRSPAR